MNHDPTTLSAVRASPELAALWSLLPHQPLVRRNKRNRLECGWLKELGYDTTAGQHGVVVWWAETEDVTLHDAAGLAELHDDTVGGLLARTHGPLPAPKPIPAPPSPNDPDCLYEYTVDAANHVVRCRCTEESGVPGPADSAYFDLLLERPDVTLIVSGLSRGLDPDLWNLAYVAQRTSSLMFHKFRRFGRAFDVAANEFKVGRVSALPAPPLSLISPHPPPHRLSKTGGAR